MKIFFSVGEPSGDQHAAHLIRELRHRWPDVDCCGFGGPHMEAAGCRLAYRLTDLAVIGFLRVVPMIGKFLRVLGIAKQFFAEERPDAVVLVDFPGFNWQVAKRASAAGIPVFYYLPPQLWAWAGWRVKRMHKWVDHVLCGLPFEHQWYADHGVPAEYVGHPFFDEISEHPLDADFLRQHRSGEKRIVGLLPGSRRHEVENNWPLMIEVVRRLSSRHPDVKFLVAGYKPAHVDRCREMLGPDDARLPLEFFTGKTPEIIEAADCCLMVSGSVSLELLARTTPAAVVYRIGFVEAWFKRLLMRVQYISLPNLIADRLVLPEWVVSGDPAADVDAMTATLDGWLSDPAALAVVREELRKIRDDVMQTGATARTAAAILDQLGAPVVTRRAA